MHIGNSNRMYCVLLVGSMLVSGGYDNTVALWDVDNMVQKLRLQVRGMRKFWYQLTFCNGRGKFGKLLRVKTGTL